MARLVEVVEAHGKVGKTALKTKARVRTGKSNRGQRKGIGWVREMMRNTSRLNERGLRRG